MDTITICDLAVSFHVGVPDEERQHAQRLLLTVAMQRDLTAAAAADDLSKTIDYYAVSRRLISFGEGRSWKLIETLATDLATTILRDFDAQAVTVTVKKFILPEARYVAVSVTRQGGG